jgi:hypothetical protein
MVFAQILSYWKEFMVKHVTDVKLIKSLILAIKRLTHMSMFVYFSAFLFLTMSPDNGREVPLDGCAIANKVGCSTHGVERIPWVSIRDVKPVCIASCVDAAVFVRVVNTFFLEKLNLITASNGGQRPGLIPDLRRPLRPRFEGESFWQLPHLCVAFSDGNFIPDRLSSLLIWHKFCSQVQRICAKGSSIAYILHAGRHHIPEQIAVLWATDKRLDKYRWFRMDDKRSVLYVEVPHRLKISPDIVGQNQESNDHAYSLDGPLETFWLTGALPMLPEGPLLALTLCGLLLGFFGAFGVCVCLNVGSTIRRFISYLMLTVFGVAIFHVGLFCLLRSR